MRAASARLVAAATCRCDHSGSDISVAPHSRPSLRARNTRPHHRRREPTADECHLKVHVRNVSVIDDIVSAKQRILVKELVTGSDKINKDKTNNNVFIVKIISV